MISVGVQLYTVRSLMTTPEQAQKTLQELKNMGYAFAQLYGSKAVFSAAAEACRAVDMPIRGILSELEPLKKYGESVFEICREYGISELGISASIKPDMDVDGFIRDVNEYAALVRQQGLSFSYHNHQKEFYKAADGRTVMEHFFEGFDPELVEFMPDTYWLQVGGEDVRYFLHKVKGRVKTLHLKDMVYTPDGPMFAEVGNGTLWFEGILREAQDLGISQFAVEQDICSGDPLESLRQSMENIKKLI